MLVNILGMIENGLYLLARLSCIISIDGNRIRMWMECCTLTSRNLVSLKQYYFCARRLEQIWCKSMSKHDYPGGSVSMELLNIANY